MKKKKKLNSLVDEGVNIFTKFSLSEDGNNQVVLRETFHHEILKHPKMREKSVKKAEKAVGCLLYGSLLNSPVKRKLANDNYILCPMFINNKEIGGYKILNPNLDADKTQFTEIVLRRSLKRVKNRLKDYNKILDIGKACAMLGTKDTIGLYLEDNCSDADKRLKKLTLKFNKRRDKENKSKRRK